MNGSRWMLSRSLIGTGSFCLVLGVLLLLVKLLMALAWYASGAIVLAGLVLILAGWLLGGRRSW